MDDFFGVGLGEIGLILLVAVLVLGPERMVEVGRWLGKARAAMRKVTSEFTVKLDQEIQQDKKPAPPQNPAVLPSGTPNREASEHDSK